jgi:hypothetical protein
MQYHGHCIYRAWRSLTTTTSIAFPVGNRKGGVSVAYRMPRAWRRTGIHADLRSPHGVARESESADGLETVRLAQLVRGITSLDRLLMRLLLIRTLFTPSPPRPVLKPPTFCWVVHAHVFRSLPLPTPFD